MVKNGGFVLKGHPLCWHTVTADWLLELTNDQILEAQLMRIKREASDFAGLIDMWDVINEVVIMPNFNKYDNGITRICRQYGRIGLVKMVFDAAREANPKSILLINDYVVSDAYEILIEALLDAGVKIDAIGIQSHMHQGFWGVEKTQEVLERFSRFGLPLHFTEVTLISGKLMPPHIKDLNDYKPESYHQLLRAKKGRQWKQNFSTKCCLHTHLLKQLHGGISLTLSLGLAHQPDLLQKMAE